MGRSRRPVGCDCVGKFTMFLLSVALVWAAALPPSLLQRVEATKIPERVHHPRYSKYQQF